MFQTSNYSSSERLVHADLGTSFHHPYKQSGRSHEIWLKEISLASTGTPHVSYN